MILNQVTLPALNIPESVAFYRKLGLKQIVDSENYSRFECPDGDTTFSLRLAEESELGGSAAIYFEHDALDDLCEMLLNE